jgi:hypothetical protein
MAHSILGYEGFDHFETLQHESQSGGASETTIVRYSKGAWRWNVSGATGNKRFHSTVTANGVGSTIGFSSWWVAFALYITTLPGAGQNYWVMEFFNSSAALRLELALNENGNLRMRTFGASFENASANLSTGKWYIVELHHVQATTDEMTIYDGDTGEVVATLAHSAPVNTNPALVSFGPRQTSTGNCVFDNLVWEADDSDANIDSPVDLLTFRYAVGTLVPTAVGFYNDWTGTFADVDEIPNDGDTSFRDRVTGSVGTFTQDMEDTTELAAPVLAVHGVTSGARFRNSTGSGGSPQILLRSGATDSATGGQSIGTSYTWRWKLHAVDPDTAVAWTVPGVDAVQIGMFKNVNETCRCTMCSASVLYSVSPPGGIYSWWN